MPKYICDGICRKILPIFYILDTSGGMSGYKISAVNEAMNETMEVLKDVSAKNPDAEIKVGVLKFSSGAEWVTNGLTDMNSFFWNDIRAGGLSCLGLALDELNKKLSRQEYLISDVGFYAPVILFINDGGQSSDNYEKALEKLKTNNKWFKFATKICVAIGEDEDVNIDVLVKIADNKGAVVIINDIETVKSFIKTLSSTIATEHNVNSGYISNYYNNEKAMEFIKNTILKMDDCSKQITTFLNENQPPLFNQDFHFELVDDNLVENSGCDSFDINVDWDDDIWE